MTSSVVNLVLVWVCQQSDCPVLPGRKFHSWYLPNIEKHVIFGSEIPIRVGIVVLSWISVEFTQSQRGIDSSHPLFKWILILKETKNGFNIINRRSNDCDVPEIVITICTLRWRWNWCEFWWVGNTEAIEVQLIYGNSL